MAVYSFSGQTYPPPPITDFVWVNQGGSTIEETSKGHLMFVDGNSTNFRMRVIPVSSPYGWTLTAQLEHWMWGNFHQTSIVIRDSVAGRHQSFGFNWASSTLVKQNWNTSSSFSTSANVFTLPPHDPKNFWLRIENDGVNNSFQYSLTKGETWIEVFSESETAWLTNPADQVGYGGNSSGSTDYYFRVIDFALEEVTFGDPSSVPGLTMWLDATVGVTTSGDDVTTWADQSGNGNDVTQTAGAAAPHSGTRTINNLNAIDFDGSAQYLEASSQYLTGLNGHVFIVWVDDVANAAHYLFSSADEAANSNLTSFRTYGNGGTEDKEMGCLVRNNNAVGDECYGDTTPHGANDVNLGMWSSDGSNYRMRYNGAELSLAFRVGADSGNWFGDPVGVDNTTVGALHFGSGVTAFLNGMIAEIVAYDGVNLTSQEIDDVETYLADKWNITLS